MTTNQRIPLAAPAALEIRCRPGRPVDVALNRSPSFRPALDTARGDGRSIHTLKLISRFTRLASAGPNFAPCLARFAFERMVEDEIEAAINKNAHVRCRRIVKRPKTLAVHN